MMVAISAVIENKESMTDKTLITTEQLITRFNWMIETSIDNGWLHLAAFVAELLVKLTDDTDKPVTI